MIVVLASTPRGRVSRDPELPRHHIWNLWPVEIGHFILICVSSITCVLEPFKNMFIVFLISSSVDCWLMFFEFEKTTFVTNSLSGMCIANTFSLNLWLLNFLFVVLFSEFLNINDLLIAFLLVIYFRNPLLLWSHKDILLYFTIVVFICRSLIPLKINFPKVHVRSKSVPSSSRCSHGSPLFPASFIDQ